MRFLTHQWVLSLVCWCVSLICLFCFPWLTRVTLEMVDRSHSKIKSFFVDFVQERQVYLHDQAFFKSKSSLHWTFHQFRVLISHSASAVCQSEQLVRSAWKCFHGLGLSFHLCASAVSLSQSISNSAAALALMYFNFSLKMRVKKGGRIKVTCTLIRTFFIQMCFETSASVKHWLQARWEQFSSLDFTF